MMSATLVILTREIKKWINRRAVLVMSLVTPIIWIAFFGKSFNLQSLIASPSNAPLASVNPQLVQALREAMEARLKELFGTTDYFTFMSTGMLVAFSLFQGMFAGVSIIFDKRLGYMDRLLTSPVPRISIWLGKVLAVPVRVTVLSVILFVTALALGLQLKPDISVLDLFYSWIIIIVISIGMASLYAMISFYASNQEVVFSLSNLLNLPLMFTSSVMFPVKQMPHWLQEIAKINPVTYAADLVRHYLIGYSIANYWEEVGYLVVLSSIITVLSAWLSVRWMEKR